MLVSGVGLVPKTLLCANDYAKYSNRTVMGFALKSKFTDDSVFPET